MKPANKKRSEFLTTGVALAAIAALTATALASNLKICWEGEGATSIQSPLRKAVPGPNKAYSGRGYLDIPWDENKTKGIGQAGYRFSAKKAGTYYVWARTFWANGCGNSIAVSVNGGAPITLGEDGTYDAWHWVGGEQQAARVKLKAGVNTLVLKNRETGVRVDQFFLCEDPEYVPTGIRKVTR